LIWAAIIIAIFFALIYAAKTNENKAALLFLGNENLAPIIYQKDNKAQGLVVDITKELSKKIGYNIDVEAIDWGKAQNKVLSGEADALLQININPEREKIYDFSTELLKSEFSIFKKYGDTSINDVSDLKNKKVGVELVGYPRSLLESYHGIDIVIIPDWISGFEMIESELLDALVVDRWIGEYALAKSKTSKIEVIEEPIEIRYSYIAVRKGNEELLKLINKGLKTMKNEGMMDKILSQWTGEKTVYFTRNEIKRSAYYLVFGIFTVMFFGTVFIVIKLRKINSQLELKVLERTKELHEANKKLKRISITDELTNLFNRRYFNNVFQKTWEISVRKNQPISLILLDIDHFKKCNDTYGHLAGDYYLRFIANILKESVKRPGDIVARFGGEEFIIILYDTPEAGARMLAEQIRKTVENTSAVYEDKKIRLTVSLGVATLIPNADLDSKGLIRLADQAMYQAKDNGRNQVVVA